MAALSPTNSKRLMGANLICAASMVLWAAGLPAADTLIPLVPPVLLTAARVVMAAAFLLPIWWLIDGGRALLQANWGRGILVGGVGFALGAYLMILGQSMTGPVTVAVISATMPVMGIALEVVFDKRRVTFGLIIGLFLSLIGGAMVVLGLPGEVDLDLGLGAAVCFSSVLSFTLGSRWAVTAFPTLSTIGRTTITLVGAAICIALAATAQMLAGGPQPQWQALGWNSFAALVIFAVGGMAVSQVLWISAVDRLGIGVSAMHINMTPFYVMLIIFALGGSWSWLQALSAAIVGLGVLIAQGILPVPSPKPSRPL